MAGPLTKSRFKLALDCPTKLHYAKTENGYRNRNDGNDFLAALADGGHQVGMLAKFLYHDDPVGAGITIETLDKTDALAQTREMLQQPGRVVIAEAALEHGTCFIRVDLLVKEGTDIELIEVKSKSVTQSEIQKGLTASEFRPYLYDIAFQTLVAEQALPGYTIRPKLLLIDKEAECSLDGLHQMFRVVANPANRTVEIQVAPGVDRSALRTVNILREVDVAGIVNQLRTQAIDVMGVSSPHNAGLQAFMTWAATIQQSDRAFFGGVTKTCKSCEFRADAGDQARSGVHECWQRAIDAGQLARTGNPSDRSSPLSVDIWGGGSGPISMADRVISASRAFIRDVQEDDVRPKTNKAVVGLNAFERRMAQVNAFRSGPPIVLREDRLISMDEWHWPLHMIDFETSSAALPFFRGMRPYEVVPFQFSHHIAHRDEAGQVRVEHATQWISTTANTNPNLAFVRALKTALMPSNALRGTVLRYHSHENTVLRRMRGIVAASGEPDAQQLVDFIDLITKPAGNEGKDLVAGPKEMVDLHAVVKEGYYSKVAGGSISLKYILPAILHDAPEVAGLFSRPGVFASPLVTSLNFSAAEGHVWLRPECGNDPYKTLPPIFTGDHAGLNDMLIRLAGEDDEGTINQGGLAMTAWNFTQFADISDVERESIRSALLRYCELDTLAMVLLVLGLYELRNRPMPFAQVEGATSIGSTVCSANVGRDRLGAKRVLNAPPRYLRERASKLFGKQLSFQLLAPFDA